MGRDSDIDLVSKQNIPSAFDLSCHGKKVYIFSTITDFLLITLKCPLPLYHLSGFRNVKNPTFIITLLDFPNKWGTLWEPKTIMTLWDTPLPFPSLSCLFLLRRMV